MNSKHILLLFAATATITLFGGCAFGVTNVRVAHSPMQPVAEKREGTILVRQFVDQRKEDQQYIGTKRNGFGMPLGNIGIRDGKRADVILTEFFVEALKHAGYDAIIQPSAMSGPQNTATIDAVLQGEIRKFWLDLYMATWHDVNVHLKLLDKTGRRVVWEKEIEGGKANVLWLGVSSEFEKVIRQAIDQALNRAAKEFASEEFHTNVKTPDLSPATTQLRESSQGPTSSSK